MGTLMKHTTGWEGHIAVCLEGRQVAGHFGAMEALDIYTVSAGTLTDRRQVRELEAELPELLQRLSVDLLVVGRIGSRALGALNRRGIRVIDGVKGPADEAAVQLVVSGLGRGQKRCGGTCCSRCIHRGAKPRCGNDA